MKERKPTAWVGVVRLARDSGPAPNHGRGNYPPPAPPVGISCLPRRPRAACRACVRHQLTLVKGQQPPRQERNLESPPALNGVARDTAGPTE
jgi:hypothetical protein